MRLKNRKTFYRVNLKRTIQICCACVKADKNKALFIFCYMFNLECPNKLLLYFYLIVSNIKDELRVISREMTQVPLEQSSAVWRAILGSSLLVLNWGNEEDAQIVSVSQKFHNVFWKNILWQVLKITPGTAIFRDLSIGARGPRNVVSSVYEGIQL